MTVTDLPGTAWLRALKSDPAARTVLVCFPPGGGSVTAYRALAQRFGSGAAVFGVQYPGRLDRLADAPVPVLTELAERAAADLLAWPRDVRLAIFGHSMGATVAYETARRVEAGGRAVSHLFVSGRPAPAFEETSRVHEGPDAGLIAELERLSNDPESVRILRDEPGLAELVLPAVRNDYRAVETYRHAPGAPCGPRSPRWSEARIPPRRPRRRGVARLHRGRIRPGHLPGRPLLPGSARKPDGDSRFDHSHAGRDGAGPLELRTSRACG